MNTSHLFGRIESDGQRDPASPSTAFNVWEELLALRESGAWKNGTARKTLVRYPEFRIDLIAIAGGSTIPRHVNAGRIAVQCVSGVIRIRTDEQHYDLPPGEILVLDQRVWHDVEASLDGAFLLTVSLPHADVPALFNGGRWAQARETSAPKVGMPA